MFIVSIATLAAALSQPDVPVAPRAASPAAKFSASARILVAQSITASAWKDTANSHKRDIVRRDTSGQWIQLRLIENE
jgi:hypothetical protein